jgi:hypothetical protein
MDERPPHGPRDGREPRGRPDDRPRRWVAVAVGVIAIAVLGLMVFLHLTGVLGPGTH